MHSEAPDGRLFFLLDRRTSGKRIALLQGQGARIQRGVVVDELLIAEGTAGGHAGNGQPPADGIILSRLEIKLTTGGGPDSRISPNLALFTPAAGALHSPNLGAMMLAIVGSRRGHKRLSPGH